MNKYLLILILLFAVYLNAQSLLPKAGEYLSDDTSILELMKNTMPKVPYNNEKLTVIDFDSSNTSFKGNFPFSYSYALAMSPEGDLVFVGSGGGIYVTDVSDPQNPVVLSEVRTRSLVDQCTYDPVSKRLYVCAYFSGIEIWDLSDLYNPTRMSRFATEPYPRSGVAYIGDYLFFTTNYSIWSLDISDPYNPVIADELLIGNNLIVQMYLKGNTAYIVTSSQGVKLVNVTNPIDLQLLVSYGFFCTVFQGCLISDFKRTHCIWFSVYNFPLASCPFRFIKVLHHCWSGFFLNYLRFHFPDFVRKRQVFRKCSRSKPGK